MVQRGGVTCTVCAGDYERRVAQIGGQVARARLMRSAFVIVTAAFVMYPVRKLCAMARAVSVEPMWAYYIQHYVTSHPCETN